MGIPELFFLACILLPAIVIVLDDNGIERKKKA